MVYNCHGCQPNGSKCKCICCNLGTTVKNKLHPWALSEPYVVGDRVVFDSISFTCTVANEGSPENMPGQGVNWKDFWIANIPPQENKITRRIRSMNKNKEEK